MEAITPYLNFNGNASEALAFYSKALEGKVIYQQTFGESPMPHSPEMKNKVMHASFQADKLTFMVSDCPPEMSVTAGSNISLSLNFADEASIDKTFAALSEGSKITMPLQDTFWGARFGMVKDKFGISWMLNCEKQK